MISGRIEVVACGLGPMGRRIATRLAGRTDLRLVAAVDSDPDKRGLDLAELLGSRLPAAVTVLPSFGELGRPNGPGVAMLATSSRLEVVEAQIAQLVGLGWNVLSTCEELVHPKSVDPAAAERLHIAATHAGVTILGSGINPGFLMDTLVFVLSTACTRVRRIQVRRSVDTNQRRLPLQQKAGVGMEEAWFRRLATETRVGHVGLRQSAHLVADRLGWPVTRYEETLEPVLATAPVETGLGRVEPGGVLGLRQSGTAWRGTEPAIRYELEMSAGAQQVDAITIEGEPEIRQVIAGGVNGDAGTEAVVANLVRPVAAAPSGLLTMADLVPLGCAPAIQH